MLKEVLIFLVACMVLIKSADYTIKAIGQLARHFRLTEFVTSFMLVAFVSALPEFFIGIMSAIQGAPNIGLGTMLGGNIADLTLILGLVGLAGGQVRVKSSIIKKDMYLGMLCLLPILLALNGTLSRFDGAILIFAGIAFLVILLKERAYFTKSFEARNKALKNTTMLILGIVFLLGSAHFIVQSTKSLAIGIGAPPIIMGLILVALGTTLPEFIFSLRSVRKGHADMAIGDLWGTVIIDATIGIGIIAMIAPITINIFIMGLIGVFTAFAVFFALAFMKTDGFLSKNEAMTLVLFYVGFVIVQILIR